MVAERSRVMSREYEPVYGYSEYPVCPECGTSRGRAEQLRWKFCYGEPREGARTDDTCRFGPLKHYHVACLCSFEFAISTNDTPQLTAQEIRDLREVLAGLKVSLPAPSTEP